MTRLLHSGLLHSIQARLLIGLALCSAVVMGLSELTLRTLIHRQLLAGFDTSLQNDAVMLASLIDDEGNVLTSELSADVFPRFERSHRPEYFEILRTDGTHIEGSVGFQGAEFLRLGDQAFPGSSAATTVDDSGQAERPLAGTEIGSGRSEILDITLPSGQPGRSVAIWFVPTFDPDPEDANRSAPVAADPNAGSDPSPDTLAADYVTGTPLVFVLARDTFDLHQTLHSLRTRVLLVFGVAAVTLLLTAFAVVRKGLAPLRSTAATIARLHSQNLDQAIDVSRTPLELRCVVERLNELMARLQLSFTREKTFSDNIAHELRTPVAGLRSVIETTLAQPRTASEYREALQDCLKISHETQGIVETLLTIARSADSSSTPQREEMDLSGLLRTVFETFALRVAERGLHWHWDIPDQCTVVSSTNQLRLILSNLFDNAVSYCDAGGDVSVVIRWSSDVVVLAISNSGCRVAPEDVSRVFDRFWRGESARRNTGTHAGMGLTLCRQLADSLGITITADISGDQRFEMRLIVPRHR